MKRFKLQSEQDANHAPQRRDLFGFIRLTMCVAAMYPFSHYKRHTLHHCQAYLLHCCDWCYELFCYFVSVHILVLYICTILINFEHGDLEIWVNCLIQTIIYSWTVAMKLYFRRVRPKLLDDIFSSINDNYQLRSEIGFSYVNMQQAFSKSNLWIKSYVYCCYIGTIFWLVLPIAYRDHSLPLACWYPFDFRQPVIYELVFFMQAVGQIQVAAAFAASSGFHMVLGILISGQYDLLFCSLKNVIASAYVQMGANAEALKRLQQAQQLADAELNQYAYSLERQTPLKQLLSVGRPACADFRSAFKHCFRRCMLQHHYILQTLDKIEQFYNPIWFFKLGEVTLLLCLVAFVSVKSTSANSLMRMVSLGQYLLLVMYEMFIICYYSDLVYQNSQRCGDALWRSPWHLHMQQIRSDYLFFMLNAKRQFQLSAGKIYNLNVERFRGTITTAFSFLTLLQKMDARN